jgi:hypothetical protein
MAAAGVEIGNENGGHTAAILAQLTSLKMIAHLQRETEERQRADKARMRREADERRRAGEERDRVDEAHRASNNRLSSIVQLITQNVRVLEQEQGALKKGQAALQKGHATLAATQEERRTECFMRVAGCKCNQPAEDVALEDQLKKESPVIEWYVSLTIGGGNCTIRLFYGFRYLG